MLLNRAKLPPLTDRKLRDGSREDESGNATVEFLGLGFMLMVPTLYFLLCVFALQSGAMAASAASQQAVQTLQRVDRESVSVSVVEDSAVFIARDYGIAAEDVEIRLSCSGDCSAESALRVEVTVSVGLPLIPWIDNASVGRLTGSATAWGGKYR